MKYKNYRTISEASEIGKQLKQDLETELNKYETLFNRVVEDVKNLQQQGSVLKSKYNSSPVIRGRIISNLENPVEYNASVAISNFANPTFLNQEISDLKKWIVGLRSIFEK